MGKSLKFFITLHKDYIMKCELLKRTAIALFVGSIVSTYAMAEDDTTNTLKSAVSKLATGIQDNLLPAIAANRTDIDKNTSNIKELAVGIQDNILPALEANRTDIDANKAAIGELAKATDEAVTNLGNAVSGLDEDLAGTQDAVAENRKDIDKNTSNIKELAVGIQDNLLPAIAANRTDIDKNTSNIKELAVGIQDNILPALEANRTDIDKNASRITDTRNKQVLQNARLDNHSSRIDANKAALETKADKTALEAKADKTALEAKADKTALEAKADKTALEAKADKVYVGSLEQNIRDNSNRIETNKVAVSALRNDINSHAKRLDHLDNRVNKLDKDLKRGLATQAALTGLFQPYTVGKANFTAAVGGYKSQTAVAIGTGYRYNKHVATKAGVAFTQGGAAYNVGVNFEW